MHSDQLDPSAYRPWMRTTLRTPPAARTFVAPSSDAATPAAMEVENVRRSIMLHLVVSESMKIVFLEHYETPDDELVDLQLLDSSAVYPEASDRDGTDCKRPNGARAHRDRCYG